MYAVLKSGGKQYKVEEGQVLRLEKLHGDVGSAIKFDQILMVGDGEDIQIGQPLVDGASVEGHIIDQGRAKKIIVFKYKRRKRYRRKLGHRQEFTAIQIDSILTKGKPASKKAEPEKEAKAPAAKKTAPKKAEPAKVEAKEPKAKKAAPKKEDVKEAETKTAAPKKPAAKKTEPAKKEAKKADAEKVEAKKAAAKKPAAKKTTAKNAEPKKAPSKKEKTK
jgi:large subunit ribosomal protein L21